MKGFIWTFAVLLTVMILAAMLPVLAEAESNIIDSVEITIKQPTAGTTSDIGPVVTLPVGAKYTLNKHRCNWMDDDYCELLDGRHTFVAGEEARAFIDLTADEGYQFSYDLKITINGGKGRIDPNFGIMEEDDWRCFMALVEVTDKTSGPASVKLSETKLTFKDAQPVIVTAELSDPADAILKAKSSDTKVVKAKVAGNEITVTPAKNTGKATITVTTKKGATAKLTVTVKEAYSLNEKNITLQKGEKFKITVSAFPSGIKAKSFESSKPKVAKVDKKGKITARKPGSTTIKVTLSNGKTLKLKVKVK